MKEIEYIPEEKNVEAEKHISTAQKIGVALGMFAGAASVVAPDPNQVEFLDAINNEVQIVKTVGENEANLKEIVDGNVRYKFDEETKTINVYMTENPQENTSRFLSDTSKEIEWENVELKVDMKDTPSTYELIYAGAIEPTKEILGEWAKNKENEDIASSLMDDMELAKLDEQEEEIGDPPCDGDIIINDESTIIVDLVPPETDIEDVTSILIDSNDSLDGDINYDSDDLNYDSDDDSDGDFDDGSEE